jgi:hypothetical protein
MDSKKTVFFVLLVLILYFASIQLVLKMIQKQGKKPMMVSMFATLIFTILLLILLRLFAKKGESKDGYQLLEISPAKKCIGGPYMWGDVNSPTFKYCSDPKNQQAIKDVSCCLGFVGMPVKYSYTPESDSQWENPRCHIYGSGHIDGVGS